MVTAWCGAGLAFGLPSEWFLLSNLIGTLVTLLILLLMQHSQNRDMHALQVKVDELIRASATAGNHWIGVEAREAHEIEQMAADRQADS